MYNLRNRHFLKELDFSAPTSCFTCSGSRRR